ncbi:hypothetical protein ABBQ38_001017 [Trebouxia sp. C0009 RCD-2024]
MNLQATVCAALANLCGWIHYGAEIKTNSGQYHGKVAALGAWSCGQVWDYVPGRSRNSEPAAPKHSKAYVFFSGYDASKTFLPSIGQATGVHIGLEIKQIPAGFLWDMYKAVKERLSQVTQAALVQKVVNDIPKAVAARRKLAETWRKHPPPDSDNELAWIEWGKHMASANAFDPTKESDYHRPLDAEMKWLYTLLFDLGLQADLKARLSKMSMDLEVILYLYVTQEPCNFCVQMLLLHHSQLKDADVEATVCG